MNILQTWKETLTFFEPKQFNLFMLVTFKSVKEALTVLFTYWWWFLVPAFLLVTFVSPSPVTWNFFTYLVVLLFFQAIFHVTRFLIILSTRSSVNQKNYNYFIHYISHFWYLMVISWAGQQFGLYFKYPLSKSIDITFFPLLIIFLLLFTLFTLDSKGTVQQVGKSVSRAFWMVIYNLPFWIIIYASFIVLTLPIIFSGWFIGLLGIPVLKQLWVNSFIFLYAVFKICFVTNVYIRKLHEQSDLYFPQP